jgi:hypothetical protein
MTVLSTNCRHIPTDGPVRSLCFLPPPELRADLAKQNLAELYDGQAHGLSLAYEVKCGQEPMTLPT